MKGENNFLRRYLHHAPVFLAIERAIECRLISQMDLKRPLLDLGCGDGLFSSILFSGPVETGIDISFQELKKAKGKKVYRNLIMGNIEILPIKKNAFNTIICNSVMEHVIDFKKAFAEARRILSSKGKFILALPTEDYDRFLLYPRIFNGLGLKKIADFYIHAVNNTFRHYHAYPVDKWVKLLEDNGFKVTKTLPYCQKNVMSLNDLFLPFSAISFFNKKIFKRWILFPFLRKHLSLYLEVLLRKSYLYTGKGKGACVLIETERA